MAEQGNEDEEGWRGPWYDDDTRIDIYALFVLEDVPNNIINDVLRKSNDDADEWYLWLADDYNNLPDFTGTFIEGTHDTVDEAWRSPILGSSLQDAADYLRSVPKPPKSLCKSYFAVLDRKRYEEHDDVMICRIDEEGELQSIPCDANFVGTWLTGHDRDTWDERFKAWSDSGKGI